MQTLFKFLLLIVGGVLVLTGCSSADLPEPLQLEQIVDPTPTPKQMTREEITEVQAQAVSTSSDTFVFYDSYADW